MGKGKGTGSCEMSSYVITDAVGSDSLPATWNTDKLNIAYVDDPRALKECLQVLGHPDVTRIALDIETTGGLRPQSGTIRLIQVGVELPEPRQFLIDAWAVNPSSLMPLLQDPDIEILTCNGRYEQTWLGYHHGVQLNNLYDVCYTSRVITGLKNEPAKEAQKQALKEAESPFRKTLRQLDKELEEETNSEEAAKIERKIERLNRKRDRARREAKEGTPSPRKIGADFRRLMRRYVGKKISKTEQTSAWHSEQLTASQRRYAAMDVAGLLDIRRAMEKEVQQKGLQAESRQAAQSMIDSCIAEAGEIEVAPTDYVRLGKAMMNCRDRAELDRLYRGSGALTIHHSLRSNLPLLYQRRIDELSS